MVRTRDARAAEDLFGHRTEKEALEAASAMRTEDQQVRRFSLSLARDFLGRLALSHDNFDLLLRRGEDRRAEPAQLLNDLVHLYRLRQRNVSRQAFDREQRCSRFVNVEEPECRSVPPGQHDAVTKAVKGKLGKVNGAENAINAEHVIPPGIRDCLYSRNLERVTSLLSSRSHNTELATPAQNSQSRPRSDRRAERALQERHVARPGPAARPTRRSPPTATRW